LLLYTDPTQYYAHYDSDESKVSLSYIIFAMIYSSHPGRGRGLAHFFFGPGAKRNPSGEGDAVLWTDPFSDESKVSLSYIIFAIIYSSPAIDYICYYIQTPLSTYAHLDSNESKASPSYIIFAMIYSSHPGRGRGPARGKEEPIWRGRRGIMEGPIGTPGF